MFRESLIRGTCPICKNVRRHSKAVEPRNGRRLRGSACVPTGRDAHASFTVEEGIYPI
jgi:hypothetical protein